jgi:hypothetical protein
MFYIAKEQSAESFLYVLYSKLNIVTTFKKDRCIGL